MQTNIILTVESNDVTYIENKFLEESIDFERTESDNFDGLSEVVQIILAISSTAIPIIGKIIIELIRAKKQVYVKYKNVEMKGMDEEKMLSFLKKIITKENKNSGNS